MPTVEETQAQAKEREISLEEAKVDQAPEPEGPVAEEADDTDVVNILRPKAEPKTWRIGPEGMQREYVQRPLSFIAKMQWFALVGDVLDKAMSGPNAMSINSLLSAPQGRGGVLTMEDFRDADTFVQAVGKLIATAPDFLTKSYCIWLNVPDYEREVAMQLMELPEEEGGLSDDQGIEMIEIFIDQNYEALDRFFREKLAGLRDRVQEKQKALGESRQSRR